MIFSVTRQIVEIEKNLLWLSRRTRASYKPTRKETVLTKIAFLDFNNAPKILVKKTVIQTNLISLNREQKA